MFARIVNGEIVAVGDVPHAATRVDSGGWVLDLRNADVTTQRATGWWEIVETAQPAPSSAAKVVEGSVALVEGVPTRTWTERDKTAGELAADVAATTETTLRGRLTERIDALQVLIDYPALPQVPAGSALTATQLTAVVNALRNEAQLNRAGAQQLAVAVRDLARLVRGDFGELD